MDFEWSPTIGTISIVPNTPSAQFFSGPLAGTGKVTATVKYGGRLTIVDIPINVQSPAAPTVTAAPTPSSPTATLAPSSSSTTTSTATVAPAATAVVHEPIHDNVTLLYINQDKELKSCISHTIADKELTHLLETKITPSSEQFEGFVTCFASHHNIIPSPLAPVAAAQVRNLPLANHIKIAGVRNTYSAEKKVLNFHGTATPGSTVLLYIFSEPLVLATKTDANGNWSYDLQDPLQPGHHEAYAVVNSAGSYKKANLLSFIIGKAEATAANPTGNSLDLKIESTATPNKRASNGFIVGTIGVILLMITVCGLGIRHRLLKLHEQTLSLPPSPT
ncbi:MAG: hypothetical protein NVS1B7_5000 [Candidatus Saccharimonadales bacterium]